MATIGIIVGIFAGAFGLGFSGAVPLGPMFAATVIHARQRGWRAGTLVSLGHGFLELLVVLVIVFGAGRLLVHPAALRTVAVAGGVFLLFTGLRTIAKSHTSPGLEEVRREGVARWWSPVLAGVWSSISQPYFPIWWGVVGATAVVATMDRVGLGGVVAFYLGHVLADVTWFTLVAGAVGAGRGMLSEAAFGRLLQACGVLLAGFGLAFVAAGLLVF